MKVWDIINRSELEDALNSGLVRMQRHPEFPSLVIANYTEAAVFQRVWNDVTINCRGLIFDEVTGDLYARPFPKFFNHGESNAPELPLDVEVWASDKIDGSLGIIYRRPDGNVAVATRGSFTSDQAQHATKVLHSRGPESWLRFLREDMKDQTYLVEIVYPENRIVCDYGDLDELILLGVRDFDGTYYHPDQVIWDGLRAPSFAHDTLRDALSAPPRPGAEGMVLYVPEVLDWVKLKQDDYLELHRIVTGLNAKRVWEAIRDGRSAEEICEPLPDEFHDFVKKVALHVSSGYSRVERQVKQDFEEIQNDLRDYTGPDWRRQFAVRAVNRSDSGLLFMLLDGKDISKEIWKQVEPSGMWSPFS